MLRTALANAALGNASEVPFTYALDQLARRWNVPPWALEDAPLDWLVRGLEFARMEGSVKRG